MYPGIIFQGDAPVQGAVPVFTDGKVLFESIYEVVGMFFTNIFDSKIIDQEGDLDRSRDVLPKAGGV